MASKLITVCPLKIANLVTANTPGDEVLLRTGNASKPANPAPWKKENQGSNKGFPDFDRSKGAFGQVPLDVPTEQRGLDVPVVVLTPIFKVLPIIAVAGAVPI